MVIDMSKVKGKILASNRKARHDFFIEDTMETGIVLTGTEVKSMRQGRLNLKDSYAMVENGEVFIHNMHISPYEQGNIYNVDPLRKRKLLLNKSEIRKLIGYITQKGYSLIPLSAYLKNGKVKIELSLAKGKKLYDKRQDIAKKDAERRIRRHLSEKY
ncbi:SsrA-binding protein SmpB [Gottschalkia purinilytica]|uniref:SsrA-binding protein n=2 Tax=Gottschalkia purinilytica TaxID=1503 RepID=A0A0L0WFA1_GOTPU|nr:SsrA-binding protein SmpB [Gottschalkia purinilytica]